MALFLWPTVNKTYERVAVRNLVRVMTGRNPSVPKLPDLHVRLGRRDNVLHKMVFSDKNVDDNENRVDGDVVPTLLITPLMHVACIRWGGTRQKQGCSPTCRAGSTR